MKREGILCILAGILLVLVCVTALADAPEPSAVVVSQPSDPSVLTAGSVDLNTASKETLKLLPKIGEKAATAIVEYRERYEGFESVEELAEVDGITVELMEELRTYLTVSPIS